MHAVATTPRPLAAAVAELRTRLQGSVLVEGEDGYDEGRLAWNRAFTHRPAVIVRAAAVGDVVATVRFAADTGLGLAVQATGHGVARVADGAVLLLTGALDDVSVDPEARTAWVSAGATWAPVLTEAQRHGLAPLLGSAPDVGAVGYTLGGGVGWLARAHGAAVDKVRRFEVVTPDGRLVEASAEQHPELFRALRGGGGGALGVVTGMEIELVPVTTVYGGNLLYPVEAATEVVAAWREWVEDAPDELTSEVVLMNFPPIPDVPEPIRGRSFAIVRGAWCGDLDEGRALLDEWRRRMPPVMDLWAEMPFSEVGSISNDPVDPLPARITGGWIHDVTAEVAEALVEMTFPAGGPPPLLFSEIRHLGGAVSRGDRAGSVLGHRDERFLFQGVGVAPTPEAEEALVAHLAALRARLAGALTGGTYLNFVEGEERRARTGEALSAEDAERLRKLKVEIDPDDVLRFGVDLDA